MDLGSLQTLCYSTFLSSQKYNWRMKWFERLAPLISSNLNCSRAMHSVRRPKPPYDYGLPTSAATCDERASCFSSSFPEVIETGVSRSQILSKLVLTFRVSTHRNRREIWVRTLNPNEGSIARSLVADCNEKTATMEIAKTRGPYTHPRRWWWWRHCFMGAALTTFVLQPCAWRCTFLRLPLQTAVIMSSRWD